MGGADFHMRWAGPRWREVCAAPRTGSPYHSTFVGVYSRLYVVCCWSRSAVCAISIHIGPLKEGGGIRK